MIKENELLFARMNEEVKIPSKRVEDCGYDIYAYFEEETLTVAPHETKMIPTGLYCAMTDDYVGIIKDRGSNGSIGLQTVCGVIDSGFRNQIFIAVTNTNTKPVVISKKVANTTKLDDMIMYPYTKGIAQMMILPVPKMAVREITVEELQAIESERGLGSLGSSGK